MNSGELLKDLEVITIEKCPCGMRGCSQYHLRGIGSFCQGSGFTEQEAQLIADTLNEAREHDYLIRNGKECSKLEQH